MTITNVRQCISLAIENRTGLSALALTLAIVVALMLAGSPAAHAQTYSVIHNFSGGLDGGTPFAGVTLRGGNLYGTTTAGGVAAGTVYELTRSGSDWVNTTLSSLAGGGFQPLARAIFGPDGKLYSTTTNGGKKDAGVVFTLTPWATICPSLNCSWRQNLAYQFQGSPKDGAAPWYGDLIFDQQGNIYGTTQLGGPNLAGTVFELTPSGNGYTENVLYTFPNFNEGNPRAGLVMDGNGNLFGTASAFGGNLTGKVFELSFVPGVGWMETDLYKFNLGDDGGDPEGGLVMDRQGNLYGATAIGGNAGGGTIFELSPSGNTWIFKVLYSFSGPGNQNTGPHASLSMDAAGNLYGTTFGDGAHGYGNIFKLTNSQNGWVYTDLHDFDVDGAGSNPTSNVTIDTDGTLYGTASYGGVRNCNGGCGIVWMIKP